jgi:hypothetical protein
LLLQQNGNLTPDQVKALLMQSTYSSFPNSTVVTVPVLDETFTEYYDSFSVGSGLLNMQSALSDRYMAPSNLGAALSPSVTASYTPRSGSGTVSIVDGNASYPASVTVWGSSRPWAFSAIWCDVTGTTVVWDVPVPWNDNLLTAFSVVWGSSTGSGTQAASVVWGSVELDADYDVLVLGDNQ